MSHIFPIYFGGPCSWNRARLRSEDLSLALGPGSSSWGRRPRRQLATVSMGDVAAESESDNSEPDLGDLMGFHGILWDFNGILWDLTLDLWDFWGDFTMKSGDFMGSNGILCWIQCG